MTDSPTPEVGPVYGVVPLVDSLPLGDGGMLQAMPSRGDLERVYKSHAMGARRVVAGYEVLLSHYHRLVKEVAELKTEDADVVALLEAAADVCEHVASCDPSDT